MIPILSQLFKLPLTPCMYGMKMMLNTMQGMGQAAGRGLNMIFNETSRSTGARQSLPTPAKTLYNFPASSISAQSHPPPQKEETEDMPNTDLNNDRIKVVEYSIVSIRKEGKIFPGFPKTKIVSERLTDDAFAVWVVADYLENNSKKIPHKDKKYLRVCYDVLCSYEKSDPNYQKELTDALNKQAKAQKEKVKVLKQIEDQLVAKAERERIQQSILAELNKGGLLTADQLSERLNLPIDTVQQGLDALTAAGKAGEWRNRYGLPGKIQEAKTIEADILKALNDKGDFQTAEQLATTTGHDLNAVKDVLSILVADNVVQQKGDRYGLPEWSQNLDALGQTILQVLRREERTLTESQLAQETQKPLASVKESLRQLVAAAEVARHGSRYGLPTW